MGLGKASVYKYIPDYFPNDVGAAGGLVGTLGALGGFFLPLGFGYLDKATGRPESCFWLMGRWCSPASPGCTPSSAACAAATPSAFARWPSTPSPTSSAPARSLRGSGPLAPRSLRSPRPA